METKPADHPTLLTLLAVARDTAKRLEKSVHLHCEGNLEIFATDAGSRLQEALVQAIRNAIDHGIEAPTAREKNGKSPTGQIWLKITENQAETTITLRDDGAGVDLPALDRKAKALGFAPSLDLLFHPGFSTKDVATEISGRGIGLDIVRALTDGLSGTAKIDTARGAGTTLTLKIPREKPARAA